MPSHELSAVHVVHSQTKHTCTGCHKNNPRVSSPLPFSSAPLLIKTLGWNSLPILQNQEFNNKKNFNLKQNKSWQRLVQTCTYLRGTLGTEFIIPGVTELIQPPSSRVTRTESRNQKLLLRHTIFSPLPTLREFLSWKLLTTLTSIFVGQVGYLSLKQHVFWRFCSIKPLAQAFKDVIYGLMIICCNFLYSRVPKLFSHKTKNGLHFNLIWKPKSPNLILMCVGGGCFHQLKL